MNHYVTEIKNLTIIDLNSIIYSGYFYGGNFCAQNDITVEKDRDLIVKHYFWKIFLEAYETRTKSNILVYFDDKDECKDIIKLIKLIKKEFKFPTLISNLSLDEYIKIISSESPEYDEAIQNNFSLIDSFTAVKKYLKRTKLLALDKKYENIGDSLSLLLTKY